MNKTIIVSNRLPFEYNIVNAEITMKPSVGGLATGLKSVHDQGNSLWVGWSGLTDESLTSDQQTRVYNKAVDEKCITVPLTENDVRDFYFGFSNRSLWPLFHYFLEYTEYDPAQWKAYVKVNQKFADAVLANAADGDKIWIHDYHLLLLPKMVRDRNPLVSIGFFLHIPFPAFEIFRTCPWREELLAGILGADLIGFHTYDYVQHFLNSVRRIAGHTVKFNEIVIDGRNIKADSFPMGIDYERFHHAALEHQNRASGQKSELMSRLDEHLNNYPDSKLILSIDRMDYTKGIANRIRSFEYFLEQYPQYLGRVRLVMLAVPSRSDVPQYQRLKQETDELVGRINGKFATIDWTPIWYFYRALPFDDLVDLYSYSHVALITPVRDGMNLVAKEYVATRVNADGVLFLSEMAGAASEMHEALLINPNNSNQIANALHEALQMAPEEQHARMSTMQTRLSRYTVDKWALDFMKSLTGMAHLLVEPSVSKRLDPALLADLVAKFKQADNRLLMLDYDGTLVNFYDNPDDACPDQKLYDILDQLHYFENTEVVIISGRGRESVERWFGHKDYTLITDHGVWIKRGQNNWERLESPKTDWKEIIRPVMESFIDRTPGSFIEEKQYSLAWHYRKADADLADIRMRELKILLTGLVADNGLSVLEGHRVLEVKNSVVNKGRAAAKLIAGHTSGFIFAVGDDYTDEYMFEALPEYAETVKIGTDETAARYYVPDNTDIRNILGQFVI